MRKSLLLSVAALLLIGLVETRSFAGKPSTTKPVTIAFSDRTGDRIKSDGLGAYVDGQNHVRAFVYPSGSYDCILDLTHPKARTLSYFFERFENGCGGDGPDGMLVGEHSWVNIRELHKVPVGETRANTASFSTSLGYFRFLGQDTQNPPHCSTRVTVTRTSPQMWNVTTDAVVAGEAGDPSVFLLTGDVAELLQTNTLDFLGNYHMPFQLTVTCPTCQ